MRAHRRVLRHDFLRRAKGVADADADGAAGRSWRASGAGALWQAAENEGDREGAAHDEVSIIRIPVIDASATAAIDERIERERAALAALARHIHAHPELRFEEHEAARAIGDYLERIGFSVERGVAGMPTAFRARAGKTGGPRIAVLAEYDALPEIGHACGHNLIAAAAVGAFVAAAAVAEKLGGEVVLLGTPAEEGGGGKIKLIEAGAFEGIDAAMMFHPFDRDVLAHPCARELCTYAFEYQGKAVSRGRRAARRKSALVACMDTFRLIDGAARPLPRRRTRPRLSSRNGGGQAVEHHPGARVVRDQSCARSTTWSSHAFASSSSGARARPRWRATYGSRSTCTKATATMSNNRDDGARVRDALRDARARRTGDRSDASAPAARTWATSRTSSRRSTR